MMSRVKRHSQTKAKRGWLLHGPPRKRTRHRRQQPRKINASLDSVSKTDASNVKTLALSTTTESLDVDNSLLGSTARCSLTADSSRRNLFRWFSFSTVFGSKFYGGITGANRNLKLVFEFLCKLMNCGVHGLKGLQEKFYFSTETLLPARSYKRKFEDLSQRLGGLEDEVKRLKLDLTKVDCCRCSHPTSMVNHSHSEVHAEARSVAPPPPPPPPPPVLPPPPVFTILKKKQKTSAGEKPSTKRAVVTLQDLMSVKLKKTRGTKDDVAESKSLSVDRPDQLTRIPLQQLPSDYVNRDKNTTNFPAVSLKDIQSVSLRKPEVDAVKKSSTQTPENNVFAVKRNLRKVNIERSPGGTPIVTERRESTGTGLTPMMTRALKRKFQFANPPSASPTSPQDRRRRKSLSPLAASPCSPLSIR